MPGPSPKPEKIKRLEGNAAHRRSRGTNPVATRGLPDCPARINGAAREAWMFLSDQIAAMATDFQVDALAFEGVCVAYGRAVDADDTIAKLGCTFLSPNGYVVQRPEVSISEHSWKLFRSLASEFGLTPASRTRLSIEIPEKRINPFARLHEDDDELTGILRSPRIVKEPTQ